MLGQQAVGDPRTQGALLVVLRQEHAQPMRHRYDPKMRQRILDLASHQNYSSIRDLENTALQGACTLTVMLGGLPIDIKYEPRGYATTLVLFNAAATTAMRWPVFAGDGITKSLPANRIFVNDPTLYLDDRINLAWYAGNHRQPRLQLALSRILRALIGEKERVVTFGASGGGFASLYFATEFSSATAVPVNPQTNIAAYSPQAVRAYTTYAWGGTALNEVPAKTDLTCLYANPVDCRVWYVQNTGDESHVDQHYLPFMKALHAENTVSPVLTFAGAGHVRPPKWLLSAVLDAAVRGEREPPALEA